MKKCKIFIAIDTNKISKAKKIIKETIHLNKDLIGFPCFACGELEPFSFYKIINDNKQSTNIKF